MDLYNQAVANTWFPNEIQLGEDIADFKNMSEEELVIFDILTRPAPDLTDAEKAEVKKVSRELLAKLKNLLVLNWRQKETARSQLKLAIQDALDDGLPEAYTKDLYQDKCSAMFEHIYEAYPEAERQSI
jgi:type I restriction enzyme R subunit